MKTLIKYHGDCNDGTTAAVLLRRFLGSGEGSSIVTAPALYGENADFVDNYPNVDNIVYVDFTPSIETLKELLSMNYEVSIIDHHKTGAESLEKYIEEEGLHPNLDIVIDQSESGASLVYKGNEEILNDVYGTTLSRFVNLIKTRDIWLEENKEEADALTYYLISNEYHKLSINLAEKLVLGLTSNHEALNNAISQGKAIHHSVQTTSKETVHKNGIIRKVTDKNGVTLPIVFHVTTAKISDIAEVVKAMFGEGSIAVSLGFTREGSLGLGFRSSGNTSCRKLAEYLASSGVLDNGGGHDHASGGDIKDFLSKDVGIKSLIDEIVSKASETSLTISES